MIALGFPREEREAADRKWRDKHYFGAGRRYTYEIRRWAGRGEWPLKWEVKVKQAECPWFLVCLESFYTPWGALKFARGYLNRGGPPRWYERRYFDPLPPDPREVLWSGTPKEYGADHAAK